jgi:putative transposase
MANLTTSDKAKLKQYVISSVIQSLLEPPDRCDLRTYTQRLTEAAKTLGVSMKTLRRYIAKSQQEALLEALNLDEISADKDKYGITPDWQNFIVTTCKSRNKEGTRFVATSYVWTCVLARAKGLNQKDYPSYSTVDRIVQSITNCQE